mmetsp:Transcript_34915/g.76327  ORF Transcript_34915/g.76327 Transcript_34915/m.76327 type:complete len:94 (-) Transcript_34915:1189-1470(-)
MDEKTEKEWQELQGKVLDNQGKLKAVISGIRAKQGEKKRNELTEQELAELPDNTVVYKSLGRAYVLFYCAESHHITRPRVPLIFNGACYPFRT